MPNVSIGCALPVASGSAEAALAAIDDAPPVIGVRGKPEILGMRSFGIVDARNASAAGRRIAAALGHAGLSVVSGMARGIDAAAHDGKLPTGTAAVMAGGLDVIYPKENTALYESIAERGALVSEMPPGVEPTARHFPRRNRLISGMALGVLVVQAAPRSGSLITARCALDQGREVFAVCSPLDPRCRGTRALIHSGATLTESAEDILESLKSMLGGPHGVPLSEGPAPVSIAEPCAGPSAEPSAKIGQSGAAQPTAVDLDSGRRVVYEMLSPTPVTVDELVRECNLSPAVVLTILLELELAGRLERQAGGRVAALG